MSQNKDISFDTIPIVGTENVAMSPPIVVNNNSSPSSSPSKMPTNKDEVSKPSHHHQANDETNTSGDQTQDEDDSITLAEKKAEIQVSPPRSLSPRSTKNSKKMNIVQSHHQETEEDNEEFHDISEFQVPVVQKSIYTEKKNKGFFHRIIEASSPTKSSSKYLPTVDDSWRKVGGIFENEMIVSQRHGTSGSSLLEIEVHSGDEPFSDCETGQTRDKSEAAADATEKHVKKKAEEIGNEDIESGDPIGAQAQAWAQEKDLEGDHMDNGQMIHLSIERTSGINRSNRNQNYPATSNRPQEDEEEVFEAPQLVIHETLTEKDRNIGYATLNPIIRHRMMENSNGNSIINSNTSSIRTDNKSKEQPEVACTSTTASEQRLVLMITAISATNLIKVQKFGTQSPFLELRLNSESETAGTTTILRTAPHKKGGNEAEWNKKFTKTLRSRQEELYIAVKTGTMIIGEALISIKEITDILIENNYTICHPTTKEEAGIVRLQLKIVDSSFPLVVPPLSLPLFSSNNNHITTTTTTTTKESVTVAASITPVKTPFCPAVLKKGTLMYKIPYHGMALPKRQFVMIKESPPSLFITWCDPQKQNDKTAGNLDLFQVKEIKKGHKTRAFYKQLAHHSQSSSLLNENLCFSLITDIRTLDFATSSKEEAQLWVSSLRDIINGRSKSIASQRVEEQEEEQEEEEEEEEEENRMVVLSSARVMNEFKKNALTSSASSNGLQKPQVTKKMIEKWKKHIFHDAKKGMIKEIEILLNDGCPIDLLEPGSGDTLLLIACRIGDVKLVELCLSWRAKNDPHPEFGETALQVAVNHKQAKCLSLLLSTAAKSEMDAEIVNHIDSRNDAPLHVAARQGDLECLQLLLHHGADICVVEEHGRTPLHCAALAGHLECVAYLLDVGGDSVLNAGDHEGNTVLHQAAMLGNEALVKTLLESAANVYTGNVDGDTPYDIAIREGKTKCAELIKEYYVSNASPTSPASRNDTASMLLKEQQFSQHSEYFTQEIIEEDQEEQQYAVPDETVSPTHYQYEQEQHQFHYQHQHHTVEQDLHQLGGSITSRRHNSYPLMSSDDSILPTSTESSQYGYEYYPELLSPSRPITPSASAQVREVLARNKLRSPGSCFSSRETYGYAQPSATYYAQMSRQALTERTTYRDSYTYGQGVYRPPQHLQSYVAAQPIRSRSLTQGSSRHQHPANYPYDGYDSSSSSGYSSQGGHSTSHSSHSHVRRANSVDLAWELGSTCSSTSTATASTTREGEWEKHYSQEGYPYYVNMITGISQWESPFQQSSSPSQHRLSISNSEYEDAYAGYSQSQSHSSHLTVDTTIASAPNAGLNTLSPDSLVRIRLAQARTRGDSFKETEHREGGHSYLQRPTSTPERLQPSASIPKNMKSDFDSSSDNESSSQRNGLKRQTSRYEVMTGVRLSIDTTPTATVQSIRDRSVLELSPRACKIHDDKEEVSVFENTGNTGNTGNSFQKSSRPSSPRGKSKNVQLIELKRANNFAIALASFKIHENYSRIIQAIVEMNETVINLDLMICLKRFFPTKEEKKILLQFKEDMTLLGKAERFFYELLMVPNMELRVDTFLYKLEFKKMYTTLLDKIQKIKRACRDLVENYSFVDALDEFFLLLTTINSKKKNTSTCTCTYTSSSTSSTSNSSSSSACTCTTSVSSTFTRSLQLFLQEKNKFQENILPKYDEKMDAFKEDLQKAVQIDLMELQNQFHRFVTGIRPVQNLLEKISSSSSSSSSSTSLSASSTSSKSSATISNEYTSNSFVREEEILQRFIVESRPAIMEVENEYDALGQWEDQLLGLFGESKASADITQILKSVIEVMH